GIMHITAPLPRLPDSLAELYPLFDRLLAKDPAARFQTGAELIAALDGVAGLRLALPEPMPRPRRQDAARISTTPTVVTPPDISPPHKRRGLGGEPELGSLGALDAEL